MGVWAGALSKKDRGWSIKKVPQILQKFGKKAGKKRQI